MPLHISSGKPGIRWHGSFFVDHSLALVNRELSLALLDSGRFEIGIEEYETASILPTGDGRLSRLAARVNARPTNLTATIRHFWPPDFRQPETGKLVMIQPWEFGSLPVEWVDGFRNVDEAWVPSNFVREEYLSSGVPAGKVFVVPNGVNTDRFHPGVTPIDLPTQKSYKFLFVGGTIARKGIDVLLDAYSREFTADDDVTLIIKDFGAGSFYAGQSAAALIAALQAKPGAPEIVHLTEDLTEEQIAGLYAACDALVHPYRGEGYGLPIAEAMACGKPTIITGFGAALDFASERTSYLVPATRVSLPEKRIGALETVDFPWWVEPNRDALQSILRSVCENPAEATARGEAAAREIAEKHTWAHAAAVAAERLDALCASKPLPAAKPAAAYETQKQAALEAVRAKRHAEAISLCEACLKSQPRDWDVLNALAVALYRTGNTERATSLLRDGIENAPNARDFHHNLAFLLLSDKDETRAEEALSHSLAAFKLGPDSTEARRTLSRAVTAAVRELRRQRKALGGKTEASRNSEWRRLEAAVREAEAALSGDVKPAAKETAEPGIRRQRLSVVMIVKNEEKYLRGCLESVRGVADEIVVVDTGSTDASVEIAREFGAKVVSHAWKDDFAEARNVSLEHATGDWALWLDADERLAEGEANLLTYLIHAAEPEIGGYMVNIRNFMTSTANAEVCWHRACRLFRLQPNIRFTGRIHEQNMRSLQAAGYSCALSKLTLDHHGYEAEVMQERNKHERFIRMLRREVDENPDNDYRTFHLFNLANAHYTRGDLSEAARWFAQAAENADPKEEYTSLLFVEWATTLYATGRATEALRACDQAEGIGIDHPGIDFARGHAYLHLKEYALAETAFRKAIALGKTGDFVHTGDIGAYTYKAQYGLALACTGRDRFSEAITYCRAALNEKAVFPDARYLLANALRRLGRIDEACRELEALLELDPSHQTGAIDLAILLHEAGDTAAGLSRLRRATALQPENAELWSRLGDCAASVGLGEEARDAFIRARRLAPHSAEVCVNLGRAYAYLGMESDAIDSFTNAIQLDPAHANAYFNAGDLLYKLGYYPKAAETLCSALELEPDNASGFFVLGNCLFQSGEFEAACAAYEQAVIRKPEYPEALQNLTLAREQAASRAA